MTAEQINREIAEKVMGWHEGNGTYFSVNFGEVNVRCWMTESNEQVWTIDDWDPCHRIDHAWMVVEKFRIWKITKFPDSNYECVIGVGKGYLGGAIETTLQMAICLAALEAVKDKP